MEKRSFKDNGLVLCYCGDINSAQSRAIVNLKTNNMCLVMEIVKPLISCYKNMVLKK